MLLGVFKYAKANKLALALLHLLDTVISLTKVPNNNANQQLMGVKGLPLLVSRSTPCSPARFQKILPTTFISTRKQNKQMAKRQTKRLDGADIDNIPIKLDQLVVASNIAGSLQRL